MGGGAHSQWLTDGRLHLQHGPIDIVLKAWGHEDVVATAYRAALDRFQTILEELTAELQILRAPMGTGLGPRSPVGRRMAAACQPFADVFVTPMAAVAGSVADELLAAMRTAGALEKAFVNNGGDIALHVAPGQTLKLGIAGGFVQSAVPFLNGAIEITGETAQAQGVGGIATSGARGRSLSLGIADSVTVVAGSAATADVAATLIANAVDIDSPRVWREPAVSLYPDSDLGEQLVTTRVDPLDQAERSVALSNGLTVAEAHRQAGRIIAAALMLQGEVATTTSFAYGGLIRSR